MKSALPISVLALFLGACSGEDSPATDAGQPPVADSGAAEDAGPTDTGLIADSGSADSGLADSGTPDVGTVDTGTVDTGTVDAGTVDAGPFTLVSSAYTSGGMIPPRHSCRGADLQPELTWTNPPAGTQSFAIVLIDESIDFTHWVAYDIPANVAQLAEGASDQGMLPSGTQEASAYCTQFCGPCPRSTHTYTFEIFALDIATIAFNYRGGFGQSEIDTAFAGHIQGRTTLTATFTP